MEKLKKGYYYLFYKFYKFSEAAPSRWWSDWKASLVVDILELFIITSIAYYFNVDLGNGDLFYILFIVITVSNYFIFHNKDQWKDIVREFDKLPKEVNRKGSWIVLGIVFIIIINLIGSVFFMDLRAKKNQIGPYSIEYLQNKKE